MTTWITVAPGIRYREHATRKHGVKYDRYFVIRHSPDGKQTDEALGWASDGWTVKLAQEKLSELRKAKRLGTGPATLREEREVNLQTKRDKTEAAAALARQQRTVADLWDRYAKEVVAIDNKPTTTAHKTRMWTRRIAPMIGHLAINDVTNEDAGDVVRAPLRLDTTGQVVGGKAEAGNLYRLLHHMFAKALGWGLRTRQLGNPLENVSEPKVQRRERLLADGEIGGLMTALDERAAVEYPQIIAAIRAVISTGARISEVLTLRWQDIRRDEMEIHLADTKTGFSRRPISAEALAVFDSVERMPGCEYVFRSTLRPTEPLSYHTVEKVFGRIAARAGVERCSLHTLRHWFATKTANSVSNIRLGMALTGHKSHQAYLGYVHADKAQARALADEIGQYISGLAQAPSNVVPLPPRGKKS